MQSLCRDKTQNKELNEKELEQVVGGNSWGCRWIVREHGYIR